MVANKVTKANRFQKRTAAKQQWSKTMEIERREQKQGPRRRAPDYRSRSANADDDE